MKSPLVYLTLVKLKNQAKELVRHPGRLLYVVFFGALLAISLLGRDTEPAQQLRPLSELSAIVNLFYTGMLLLLVLGGSSASGSSGSMFSLSDAVLLFPSPLSPVRILFYGMLRQLGVSLLLAVFLLFQYAMLSDLYGLSFGGLLLIVLGYALTLFFAQLINMAVYTRTSGNDAAQKRVKHGVVALAVLYLLFALFSLRENLFALSSASALPALLADGSRFFSSLPGFLFPVSGWVAACVCCALTTGPLPQLLFALPVLLALAALLLLIVRSKNNYYEDALQAAETAHSTVTAQKEGQAAEIAPKHVKLGRTGLRRGWGASAIYQKHRLENRRSGVFFLSGMSILFGVILLALAVFLRLSDFEDFDSSAALIAVFATGVYLQFFSTAMGRFGRELQKPYLYLIPEPPLKKLLWAIAESMVSAAGEAVLFFLPLALILRASPPDTVFCILARISFSLLFLAGNIAVERVFGALTSRVLTFLFYFLLLALMAAPGIVLGVFLAMAELLPGLSGAFLGMLLCNIPVAVLVLFLCRNMLQYAELNNN